MTDVKAELLPCPLADELEAIRSGVDAFNPDARLAARSAFDAAERVWKMVSQIIAELRTRPQPSPKVDGLVERGRIAFIMEAAKIERDVGLHDLTEDEQRDLIAAVIKAALANPSVDFSRDLARLRDSQGLPEGDRVEVDINALCDVLSGGQALLKSVQP